MPVVSMVSSKGGAGKTTTAVTLAGEIAEAGAEVVLVDADPNRPLEKWGRGGGKPDTIQVMVDESAETIVDTIEEAQRRARFVIVDLEGTATDRIGFAITRSNFVLVPVQGSTLDADEAAKSIRLIRQMSKVAGRTIPYALFFARLPAALREKTFGDIEKQFAAGDVPIMKTALIDRAAYRSMFSLGSTLYTLDDSDVSGLPAARANSQAFLEELVEKMKATRKAA